MSSLMQFNGEIKNGKVRLQFYRTDDGRSYGKSLDYYICKKCDKTHDFIGLAWRKPVGMFGNWVTFVYLGRINAPDLSLPISVSSWPIGTKILNDVESSKVWHSQ